jgi:hypothetical protein
VFEKKPMDYRGDLHISDVRAMEPVPASAAVLAPRRSRLRWVVAGVIALVAAAFIIQEQTRKSPSERLAAEYESRFAGLQQRLAAAIAKLPPVGSVEERAPAAPLDPKPDSTNTLFVSADAINKDGQTASAVSDSEAWSMEPESDAEKRFPDARLGNDQSDLVYRWRPGTYGALLGTDDTLPPRYEDLLDTRYAVAVRIAEWIPPSRQEGVGLVAGAARVEVFLIDLQSGDVLGSLTKQVLQTSTIIAHTGDPLEAAAKELAGDVGAAVQTAVAQMVDTQFEKRDLRFPPGSGV